MKFSQGRRIEPRLYTKVETNLLVGSPDTPSKVIPVTLANLNTTGVSINCSHDISVYSNLSVELRISADDNIMQLPVKIVWQKDNNYGLDFLKLRGIDYRRLQNIIEIAEKDGKGSVPDRRKTCDRRLLTAEQAEEKRLNLSRRLDLPLFKLFIDGRDVDTGRYEFFPYADKHIAEYKKTHRIITQLRHGQIPPDYSEYVYARYCVGNATHTEEAIDSAYRASEIFRKFPLVTRLNILKDIHANLLKEKENLLKLFVIEGHPRKLAEWEFSGMEMAYRSNSITYFKTNFQKTLARGKEIILLSRKVDGIVCVSPPTNASCSNSLTAGFALLSGNVLIVKPPLRIPLTTMYLWRNMVYPALMRNGAPHGALNIIVGDSKKIMDQWLSNPKVNTIYFFGESKTGLEIGCRAYAAGKKPILELSGNDFLIVWKDADIKKACQSLLDGFLGSTQICMVPKKALIHESVYDKFEGLFLKEVAKIKVGLPSDPETFLVAVNKVKEFMIFCKDALSKGAVLLRGDKRINHEGVEDKNGAYIQPTVVGVEYNSTLPDMLCIQEENFFPLMPLIKVTSLPSCHSERSEESQASSVMGERFFANAQNDKMGVPRNDTTLSDKTKDLIIFEKMINVLNANKYGLRTSIWIKSSYFLRRFIRDVNNAGMIRINSRHVGFSPFIATHGGTGFTGGPFGEMNYIWQKTTHLQGISVRT